MQLILKTTALAVCLNLILTARLLAGPPFLTDDPEPVDYQHWEAYVFGNGDHTSGGYTVNGPAVEMNYGVLPDTQLHLIVPMTTVGGGGAPAVSGLGDTEFGVKYRFLHETNWLAANRNLSIGRTADGRCRARAGQRADVVPPAIVDAEKFGPVDDLRRRRRGVEFRARAAQLSFRRLAGATRFRAASHARRRNFRTRPGHRQRQGLMPRSILAANTMSAIISACCSARATAWPVTTTRSGISHFTGRGDSRFPEPAKWSLNKAGASGHCSYF